MLQAWLDGESIGAPEHALAVTNRGLHYGDGVFETMCLQAGQIRFLEAHLERAHAGCQRLGIDLARVELRRELERLPKTAQRAIVKLLLVRAGTGRGYRPAAGSRALRLMLLYPWTDVAPTVQVQWCTTRWSRNEQLAGLKHLNRLEQVLAQRELGDAVDEGLMLDTEDILVSATSGNIFLVHQGTLRTPDLRSCGVKGVMRAQVIAAVPALGMSVEECVLRRADVEQADELFITNALRGLRPIVQLGERRWQAAPVAERLRRALML